MRKLSIFLLSNSINSYLTCNASECLSWVIVLLNILTVFYLAFCAWFKITKSVKLFGWIWGGINVCGTVLVMFFHTCIFSLISAVFTGLITMAVLSVIFEGRAQSNVATARETTPDNKGTSGYYVIFGTTDKKFVFRLYDKSKKFFMTSCYKYNTFEEVKRAIAVSRKNGVDILLEDKTTSWIKAVNVPKFVMKELENEMKYFNQYLITDEFAMLKSDVFTDIVICSKCVHRVMNAVLSSELYVAKETLDGLGFEDYAGELEKCCVPIANCIENKTDDADDELSDDESESQSYDLTESNESQGDKQGDISFKLNTKYTFVEELTMQESTIQELYEELRKYALSKQNVKEFVSLYKVRFKWGRNDLMQVLFKNGVLECRVMAGSSELKKLVLQKTETKIKEQPTKVQLTSEVALESIKNLIDISYLNIEEARK